MKNPKPRKKLIIIALIILVIAGTMGVIFLKQRHQMTKNSPGEGGQTPASENKGSAKSGTDSTTHVTTKADPSHPQAADLAKPTGQVLNKNVISLSSNDPQTNPALNSTCQTVFEAKCGLRLTSSNGTVKTVSPQPVDSSGGVSLDWNAKSLGLTADTWKVQLLATKGDRIGLGDSYNLTVNP